MNKTVIYNGKYDFENKFHEFALKDRAFRYGDGLFETIVYRKNALRFFDDHYERLTKGIALLKMDGSNLPDKESLRDIITRLIEDSKMNSARVRLMVWRKNGGLYLPDDNNINYLIEASEILTIVPGPDWLAGRFPWIKTGFSRSVTLSHSFMSHLKTCNALPYIVASAEKSERKLDDVIILTNEGYVAETTHANIFWIKEGVLFTPSLATGCIAGVMRKKIIQNWSGAGYRCQEIKQVRETVADAEVVFTTNVTGIKFVGSIDENLLDEQNAASFTGSQYFSSIAPLL